MPLTKRTLLATTAIVLLGPILLRGRSARADVDTDSTLLTIQQKGATDPGPSSFGSVDAFSAADNVTSGYSNYDTVVGSNFGDIASACSEASDAAAIAGDGGDSDRDDNPVVPQCGHFRSPLGVLQGIMPRPHCSARLSAGDRALW
jgi:hypothetical protein